MSYPTLRDVLDEKSVSWKYYSPPVNSVPARYGTASTPSKPYAKARSGTRTSRGRPSTFSRTSATARCRRCRGSFPTSSTPIIPAITRIPDHRGSRRSSMRSVKAPTGKRRPSSSFGTMGRLLRSRASAVSRQRGRSRVPRADARRFTVGAPRRAVRRLRQPPAVRVRQHPAVHRGHLRPRTHRHDGHARDQHLGLLRFQAKPRPFTPISAKYSRTYFERQPPSGKPVDTE